MRVTDMIISRDQTRYATVRYFTEAGEQAIVRLDMSGASEANDSNVVDRARRLLMEAASFDIARAERGTDESVLIMPPDSPQPVEILPLEEDDDNPYQYPDEALPDREQEDFIRINPQRQRDRLDDD